jgi:hypothetical protein
MAHHLRRSDRQQTQQKCTICLLFQSMGRGQYRSSYDREMYLHHLQIAHGVRLPDDKVNQPRPKGDELTE